MPTSLAAMLALFNDNTSGDISAADGRTVIQALYDWIPTDVKFLAGRLPSETAHASDDFFTAYSGYTEQTPTGTATWAAGHGGLGVKFDDQAGNDMAATLKAIPGGPPLTIQTCWQIAVITGSNPGVGLVLSDGTTATSNVAGFGSFGGFAMATVTGTLTNATTSAQTAIDRTNLLQGILHVRLVWVSANNFAWAISPDGSNWTDWGVAAFSTSFTPTHMGLWVSTWSNTVPGAAVFRYLRVNESDLSV